MSLRHMFDPSTPPPAQNQVIDPNEAETETIRRIARALEDIEPDRRRYLAGFAYVLARAAHADLDLAAEEAREMEQSVAGMSGLPMAHAVLVIEIARVQSELFSGTEDYLVTREFNRVASDEQRRAAVASCGGVTAIDHEITAAEYAELTEIAEELGLDQAELSAIHA